MSLKRVLHYSLVSNQLRPSVRDESTSTPQLCTSSRPGVVYRYRQQQYDFHQHDPPTNHTKNKITGWIQTPWVLLYLVSTRYLVGTAQLCVPKYRTSCRASHRPSAYTRSFGLPIADAAAVHGIVASLQQ